MSRGSDVITSRFNDAAHGVSMPRIEGRITSVKELLLEAVLPGVPLGALVRVGEKMLQTVGSDGSAVRLAPLDNINSIQVGDAVSSGAVRAAIPVSDALCGRVVDPLLRPLDDRGPIERPQSWPLWRGAPNPLSRPGVSHQLVTGVKVLDALLPLGAGQKTGLFAGAGQGKSTLLADIAIGAASDVSVICLAGERGREAGEFVRETLGPQGLSKSVVILAPSDAPSAMKVLAMHSAVAVAEWFRENGLNVLLLLDSLTRVLRAKRDIDLALGYPAGPSGFPAPTFGFLPSLLERATASNRGWITSVYTVLTENIDKDPIADEVKSLLDGHIVLSGKKAEVGHWPAVNVGASVSRVLDAVVDDAHLRCAGEIRAMLAGHAQNEELIKIGAYCKGTCARTDAYLKLRQPIMQLVTQRRNDVVSLGETREMMTQIVDERHICN